MNINFHPSYGDIVLKNNDLLMVNNREEDSLQNIIQVLRTNYGDYLLNPNYGADLDRFIGQPVSKTLASTISKSIEMSIRDANVVPYHVKIQVPYVIRKNTIYYRIMIEGYKTIKYTYVNDKGFRIEP